MVTRKFILAVVAGMALLWVSQVSCLSLKTQSHQTNYISRQFFNHMESMSPTHQDKKIPKTQVVDAMNKLKKQKPQIYDKLKEGKLEKEDQQQFNDFLLKTPKFIESFIRSFTKNVPADENCLKDLKLNPKQQQSFVIKALKITDWNKRIQNPNLKSTPQQYESMIQEIQQDKVLGKEVAQCLRKIKDKL